MTIKIASRVLPGIGVAQEIDLSDEHRIGIVTRRNGLRDLIVYDEEGDGSQVTLALTDDEANAVAEILGAPQLTVRLATLQRQADGLAVEQLAIPADSPFNGRTLGETNARTRTGASIVAVVRQGAALPSPTPDFVMFAGDLVVTVGTPEAVDQVAQILAGSEISGVTPPARTPAQTAAPDANEGG